MLYFCFHSSQSFFLISFVIYSLTHLLFRIVLFNFHIFVKFSIFLLLLISNFIPLWSGEMLCMLSMFGNLLRLVLWLFIWSIWDSVVCALEKRAIVG